MVVVYLGWTPVGASAERLSGTVPVGRAIVAAAATATRVSVVDSMC
jgi:hypothetical protein